MRCASANISFSDSRPILSICADACKGFSFPTDLHARKCYQTTLIAKLIRHCSFAQTGSIALKLSLVLRVDVRTRLETEGILVLDPTAQMPKDHRWRVEKYVWRHPAVQRNTLADSSLYSLLLLRLILEPVASIT